MTGPAVQPTPDAPGEPDAPTCAPAPPGAEVIRLRGVHKRFGPLTVLNGIDLDIHAGQTTVILGPSGTGKSVMLKHIVGLLQPDAGTVWMGGQRVDTLNEQQLVGVRKRVGFLFQLGALFDSMTVGQNVAFPLVAHTRLDPTERGARVDHLLSMVGLAHCQNKMPGEMSGGQQKRVALARAIALEPEIMLYDEPTTGLDPIRSDVINELIINLTRRLGMTSIVVTHDMNSARKIADRMVLLYDGRVAADDTPEAFLSSEDELVQRFIRGQADHRDLALIRRGFDQTPPPSRPAGSPRRRGAAAPGASSDPSSDPGGPR